VNNFSLFDDSLVKYSSRASRGVKMFEEGPIPLFSKDIEVSLRHVLKI
jgi:hypothetical protein